MELDRYTSPRKVSTASSGFFPRGGLFRAGSSSGGESASSDGGDKGPLGLVTVHKPFDKAVADLVFIHGLGGGSR